MFILLATLTSSISSVFCRMTNTKKENYSYNKQWENKDTYPDFAGWLTSVSSQPNSTRCKFCKENPINLSKMVVQSLKIHAKSKKYQEIVKTMSNIRYFSFSHGKNDEKHHLILLRTIQKQTLMRKTLQNLQTVMRQIQKITRKVVASSLLF